MDIMYRCCCGLDVHKDCISVNLLRREEEAGMNLDETSVKELEREQTQLLYKESEMLHEQGKLSEIELQEARITFENFENELYQALVNGYTAWLNIHLFMSN